MKSMKILDIIILRNKYSVKYIAALLWQFDWYTRLEAKEFLF